MDGPEHFEKYVKHFMHIQFPAGDVPQWVVDALATADIHIETNVNTKDTTHAPVADEDESASKIAKIEQPNSEVV